ncbi:MAG: transcriptional repressor LexA [Candidatus Hydrogenedentes bacterium]|nr:transcriptional repressor LexA [Candidatus Hydrogenedentota bacterium]
MATALTKRQQAILDYIIDGIRENGYPPTISEMCEAFGITSTNGVNDHLVALEKKGYIERSSKARGIHVTQKAAADLYRPEISMAPLLGRVAAGYPLLAQENIETYVPVAPGLARGDCFCLRVSGDSMIEDGILDGDIIIVDQGRSPRRGSIVVALIDEEATVKHYHPNGSTIELRPANAAMAPMHYPAQAVRIQGVVVGLQRAIA